MHNLNRTTGARLSTAWGQVMIGFSGGQHHLGLGLYLGKWKVLKWVQKDKGKWATKVNEICRRSMPNI